MPLSGRRVRRRTEVYGSYDTVVRWPAACQASRRFDTGAGTAQVVRFEHDPRPGADVLRLHEYTYHRPATVREAAALLAAHPGRARVIAGGTDLVPNMKHGLFTP